MSRLIDPGNVEMEPRYEQHGQGVAGRTVVYTPEGEYLFDLEISDGGIDPRFSLVMDAGVVEKGSFDQLFDDSEISDVIEVTEERPQEGFLGDVNDPEFYDSPSETGMEIRCFKLESEDWNVYLENPLGDYPAHLRIDGISQDLDEVKDVFSGYANRLSTHSLSHPSRYKDMGYILDESEISHWTETDWREMVGEAVELTVEVTPRVEDYRPADD